MKIVKPLTVATRTMILVGAVIVIVSLVQGGINVFLMTKDIRSTANQRMKTAVSLTQDNLTTLLYETAEDIILIHTHKSIENYFTALIFGDTDEMTNSVSTFEEFLKGIQQTKAHYAKIQLTTDQGEPILQVSRGERIETYDQFYGLLDPAQLQSLRSPAQDGSISRSPHHFSVYDATAGQAILTVTPIIPMNKVEGLLWIYQPIEARMNDILDALSEGGIICVIMDDHHNIVASSKSLDESTLSGFISGNLSEWTIAESSYPGLDWTINVGMPRAVLFSLLKKLQVSWLVAMSISLIFAMAALWGIKRHNDKLEEKIASNTEEIVKKNEQLNKFNNELQVAIRSLEEAKQEIIFKNESIENERKKIQVALDQIYALIQEVSTKQDFGVHFAHPNLLKCWEELKCDQEKCACFGKDPMRCWQVSGTLCNGKVQGTFAEKIGACEKCLLYKKVTVDPIFQIGEQFNNMMHILENKNKELVDAYTEIKATQSRILQQEKMASIGQLAAGVAHEINNPMGFITSNLGTLQKYVQRFVEFIDVQTEMLTGLNGVDLVLEKRKKLKLDYIIEDTADLLKESLDGTKRVTEIVQNLKSFSRLDMGKVTRANINECIETTLKIIWNELKYKTTIHKVYGDLPLTMCNPQELNQVFMNLLVNAAQAIDTHGEITIQTVEEAGVIKIVIADTGSGIAPDKLEHIFEPFFTTKEIGKGTGLGLSICYDILKKHDGEITVDSEVGKGTTFTVILPVNEKES